MIEIKIVPKEIETKNLTDDEILLKKLELEYKTRALNLAENLVSMSVNFFMKRASK